MNRDESQMTFELSLYRDDLRRYPSGENMGIEELRSRVYFEIVEGNDRIQVQDDHTIPFKIDPQNDEEVMITVKCELNMRKKYICCIRLGDEVANKPVFRSPVLSNG